VAPSMKPSFRFVSSSRNLLPDMHSTWSMTCVRVPRPIVVSPREQWQGCLLS